MTKTLLISYTPRYESNTQKLIQTACESISQHTQLIHQDLVKNPPPLLLEKNLNALLKKNFMGQALDAQEQLDIAEADLFLEQFLEADRIIIACPVYNFSLPAAVKAWIDVVIQKGATFDINDQGAFQGLCEDKQALVLVSSGSDFGLEPRAQLNYCVPLICACLEFMGIKSQAITAYGLDQYTDRASHIIKQTQQEIVNFLNSDPAWARL